MSVLDQFSPAGAGDAGSGEPCGRGRTSWPPGTGLGLEGRPAAWPVPESAAPVTSIPEGTDVVGIEFTTFSIAGRCERTGMLGIAIATSEMAVGSRCIHVAPGVGAIVTQASTNPRLGHLGLSLLRAGHAAPRVLEEMVASDQFVERRQLGCLDAGGRSAARTGSGNRPWAGHHATSNVVVAANAVVGAGVADAMLDVFQREPALDLWERLLRALEAGKAAGGQPNGEMSSGLYVADREPYPAVDLRVDLHATPVAELRRLASAYFPLIEYYNLRPIDPSVPPAAEWLAARQS